MACIPVEGADRSRLRAAAGTTHPGLQPAAAADLQLFTQLFQHLISNCVLNQTTENFPVTVN